MYNYNHNTTTTLCQDTRKRLYGRTCGCLEVSQEALLRGNLLYFALFEKHLLDSSYRVKRRSFDGFGKKMSLNSKSNRNLIIFC